MRGRRVSGLMLSVTLLLLAGGSGPVRRVQPNEPGEAVDASASSVANAPWVKMELDTAEDTGHHVSIAIDPILGGVYISYYDATAQHLRMAHYRPDLGLAGNCGPDDSWYCQTVDGGSDVGKYSSIAAMAGGVNISYHDATYGDLKWAESTDAPYHQTWRIRTIDRGIFPAKTGRWASFAPGSARRLTNLYGIRTPASVTIQRLPSTPRAWRRSPTRVLSSRRGAI